jgi:hypothetical protein
VGQTASVTFTAREDKKHSVKWDAEKGNGEKPVITGIYVNRPFAENAKKIRVTVEVVE